MLTPTRTERSRAAADSASSAMASRIASRTHALGVVLVRRRQSEDRHDLVADELLDHAAHALDLLARDGVIRVEQSADVLWVELIGSARVADLVREAP